MTKLSLGSRYGVGLEDKSPALTNPPPRPSWPRVAVWGVLLGWALMMWAMYHWLPQPPKEAVGCREAEQGALDTCLTEDVDELTCREIASQAHARCALKAGRP